MAPPDEFAGKVVLITGKCAGASSGIGAATAIHFARLGAFLSLTGRDGVNLMQIGYRCASVRRRNSDDDDDDSQILMIADNDLTKDGEVQRVIDETIEKFGKLDVLVNNAGIFEGGSIETTNLEQFDRVLNTNLRSVFHLTMLATPYLIKTKGVIVNVSSVNGLRSFPNCLAYNMSKAAVDQLTRCVAIELASKQVRVNSVNPGVILTKVHKRSGMDEATYQQFLERAKSTHALGRPGEAAEVAAVIAFFASNDASFITGASTPIDGGRHAMCTEY